ncbi:S-adenosyl-L-methionine-dependent methyltransferase [Elaphomyces granulatus]
MTSIFPSATAGQTVKEGLAVILTKDMSSTESESQQDSVFYNPKQQFDRDLSVLAIKAYGEHCLAVRKQKMEKKMRERKRKRGNEDGDTNTEGGMLAQVAATMDKTFKILDALSATGIRAIRYAKEIPFVTAVVANDLSASAIESMKLNIDRNGVAKVVRPNNGDALTYLYSLLESQKSATDRRYMGKFDVIDLDPHGTAAPFMDAAIKRINDGGLLCITCTDVSVFASTEHPEDTFVSYGGLPLEGPLSHEGGLRLILNKIAACAATFGLAIEPLLSLSIDSYVRIFVRIHRSPAEAKFNVVNTMLVSNCNAGCGAWTIQPLAQMKERPDKKGYHLSLAQVVLTPNCEHCGLKTHLGGPMWAGPLHNPVFIQKILDMLPAMDRETYGTIDRVEGMLTTALKEDLDLAASSKETTPNPGPLVDDGSQQLSAIIPRANPALRDHHPFLFSLSAIAKVLHTQPVPFDLFHGALYHVGYRSTRSHTIPNSIRTDAPWDVIWEVMREWVRQKSPIKVGALSSGSAGATIMRKSRDAIQDNSPLSLLKREIGEALEDGQNLRDLTTKIEAALYRSSFRLPTKFTCELNPGNADGSSNEHTHTSVAKPHPSTLNIVFDEALGEGQQHRHQGRGLCATKSIQQRTGAL